MEEFIHSTENPSAPMVYCSFGAMHTRFELLFVEKDEKRGKHIADKVEECVLGLEKSLSRHVKTDGLYALNTAEVAMRVDDELYFVLELCEQFRAGTLGYFDIAALSPTLARPAYRTFPPTHSVQRSSMDIILDLGGFGKGYAVEKIRSIMNGEGVESALVNAGNSSILGIGSHPLGPEWRVSPAFGNLEIALRDSALSISGPGEGGRAHIVNPKIGKPVYGGRDIAVSGRSALVCEVLSTALYAAPAEERAKITANFEGYNFKEIND